MLGRLSSAHAGAMHAAVHNTAAESNLKQFQRTGLLNAFERARGDSKRLQSPKNDLARIAAMNVMTYLGMPVSVRVGTTAS